MWVLLCQYRRLTCEMRDQGYVEFLFRFSPHAAKECLRSVLTNEFEDKNYDKDAVPDWTRKTSEKICGKLQELGFERYKFVVQVVIGEQRGAGTRMACRCIWDSDTDVYASEFFSNSTLFCVAVVLASYYY
ncbi:dynein light chain Tctex-type protein 2B [Ixodes scapularis]|uniref:dynein light chain Tctex-type protein 2B n=1 Tax=Ixodes scapularis TaxID=6945 RepID=UPI001A9E763D|nr:dynein light chain Tctex-type protein 2B [Ixodes scapularis]